MATYYVDPVNGSDSNNGSSIALAFKSTAKSETVVAAGDTVKLLATGTESPTSTITLSTSGAVISYVTWVGCDSSGNALASGSYYTISGASMSASTDIVACGGKQYRKFFGILFTAAQRYALGCTTDPANTIELENCSVTNPTSACFGTASAVGLGFNAIACVFTGSGSGGTQKLSASTSSNRPDVTLTGCVVNGFNIVFQGTLSNGSNPQVGNLFENNGTVSPLNYYNGSQLWQDNIFYNNNYCLYLCDRTQAGGKAFFTVLNNCAVNNGSFMIAYDSTIGTVVNDYNSTYNNSTTYSGSLLAAGLHDVSGNPLFNSPGTGDFRVAYNSPLIGTGLNGRNIAAVDQLGGGGVPLIGEGLVF